jgi:acetylornithine/N-succinyldiaminopimelate aminotransferase
MSNYNRRNIVITKGKGSRVWDSDGNEYLDFVSGVAVNALGHSADEITEVISAQAKSLVHVSNIFYNEPQMLLAKKLVDIAGGDFKAAFFCNSGTEAVEACLKIMRKHGSRISGSKRKIVFFTNSFHGRTIGALSVTAEKKYKEPYIPSDSEVIELRYNDVQMIKDTDFSDVCGAIVEVVQGEGGVTASTPEFLSALKEASVSNDFLLAFDEIQCGVGRTGKFFGFENYGVAPDLIAMAKGLGGGMPIGAVIANSRGNLFEFGDHGSTFGGNPLVCAVALKVVETIYEKDLMDNVNKVAEYLDGKIGKLIGDHPNKLVEKRGLGLLKGIKISDAFNAGDLITLSFEEKLLIIAAGGNVIRILPPLNVKLDEIDEFVEKFEKAVIRLA